MDTYLGRLQPKTRICKTKKFICVPLKKKNFNFKRKNRAVAWNEQGNTEEFGYESAKNTTSHKPRCLSGERDQYSREGR